MGQAKLKPVKPAHPAGPRGHQYFCRNRCGTVVWTKGTNATFNERTRSIPLWGWCEACARPRVQEHARIIAGKVVEQCSTQAQALQLVYGGVRLIDGQVYDLRPVLLELPAFKALIDDRQTGYSMIRMSGPPPVRGEQSASA